MTQEALPEGYEYAEVSAAKDLVYDLIYEIVEDANRGDDRYYEPGDSEGRYSAITVADKIVEALLAKGVTVPEDLTN